MTTVPIWGVHELALESPRDRDDPYWDIDLRLELTAPSGRVRTVDAFWDGGRTWRARFRPDESGTWRWWSVSSDATDTGLQGHTGSVDCVPYEGPNPLLRHGSVHVSADGRTFVHVDGTPFFWLGDTAWNGVLRANEGEWRGFLAERARQGFTVIQFFSASWRGLPADDRGESAFSVTDRVRVNPAFFARLDPKVRAINEYGLLAYAIGVLALFEEEPAWAWPEEDLARFTRYLNARWGAHHMAWSPVGDGDYSGARAERLKRVCRDVYGHPHQNLVTIHPMGWSLFVDGFRDEPWCDFISYQSCHDDTPERVRWHPFGPVAEEWRRPPARPIVNVEFNYEAHPSFTNRVVFTDHEVRRAAYWSLLISPPAGVSYGHYHEWSWSSEPEPIGVAIRGQGDIFVGPWRQAIDTPGVRSMTIMRRYFESGPWWRLRPAQEVVAGQPGLEDATRFVAAGRTDEGDWTAVYTPVGGAITLRGASISRPWSARWFDPRSGHWRAAEPGSDVAPAEAASDVLVFRAPDDRDWVLDIRARTG